MVVVIMMMMMMIPLKQFPLEKLTVTQLVKKFSSSYVTPMYITAFTRSSHLSLS
jgi:hypothetical protein